MKYITRIAANVLHQMNYCLKQKFIKRVGRLLFGVNKAVISIIRLKRMVMSVTFIIIH